MDCKDFVDTSPMDGLYSGRILHAIVQALDIEDEALTNRTARRFFAGNSVDEYNRNQIFDALGQAMITRGLAPKSLEDLPEGLPMAAGVGMSLMMACGQWDHLMAHIQSRSGKIADVGEAGAQCLRLVVVDLALRLFALNYLDLADLPGPNPPLWVLENGVGNILRQHLCRAGLTRTSWQRGWMCPVHPWTTGLTERIVPVSTVSSPWVMDWHRRGPDGMPGNCRWN